MPVLEISHLHQSYNGNPAVRDLSLQLETGEILGLLGPNGAGKTTTMMVLSGLLRPDSGSVMIDGQTLDSGNCALRTRLGVVPQDLAIYPDLTAVENLKFFGSLYALRGADLTERVTAALAHTGLEEHAHSLVRTFSGGMKRRLNFGVALLHRPQFLILDEPTVGVDPQSRSHLLECIRRLKAEGMGVLYASHYMEEVQAICQRVAIIDHGRLLACGPLADLLDRLHPEICLRVAPVSARLVHQLEPFAKVTSQGDHEALVCFAGEQQRENSFNSILARVLLVLNECGAELRGMEAPESNLERLFLELTGHRLRD